MKKSFKYILMLLLLLPFGTLPSCMLEPVKIELELDMDYKGLLAAVRDANQSVSAKLALVEEALNSGLASNQQAIQLLQEMIKALEGNSLEKLLAIEGAIKSQTTGLETKLALVEAAVQGGFADASQSQALLAEALETLGGSLEQKVEAIEDAVSSQNTALSAKLALIEAAVKEGFVAEAGQQELLQSALESLKGSEEEKLSALEAAILSQTSGLETKLALIVSAQEKGFTDEVKAIENIQKALSAGMEGIDGNLSEMMEKVSGKLKSISAQLTPEELAKAFKDIESALQSKEESLDAYLRGILNALTDLLPCDLIYLGNVADTIAVTGGEEFQVLFKVDPPAFTVTKDSLELKTVSRERFFREDDTASDAEDIYFIKSLEAHPDIPGQYVATVGARNPFQTVWEESQLALVFHTLGRKVATEAFLATLVPRITEGLNLWCYPRASFKMNVINGEKVGDSLGVIYLAMDSRGFVSEGNASKRKRYTALQVESAQFFPDSFELHKRMHLHGVEDSMATVALKYRRGQDFMSFYPDTTGKNKVWKDYCDSIGHLNIDIVGKLVLTDRWQKKDTLKRFHLGWWNTTWYVDSNLKCSVNDLSDEDGTYQDTVKIESLFDFCGIKNSAMPSTPPARFELDRSQFIYPQNHAMTGTFVDRNWKTPDKYVDDKWNILLNIGKYIPTHEEKFSLQGVTTVCVFPSESHPEFKAQQQRIRWELRLTVENTQ